MKVRQKILNFIAKFNNFFSIQFFWYPIYLVFFWLFLRCLPRKVKPYVWFRNSLLDGSFTPPISDIDISVLIPEEEDFLKEKATLKFAMENNILVHEVNVFEQKHLKMMTPLGNIFELERDPYLKDFIDNDLISSNKDLDTITFLVRTLEADIHKLRIDFSLRKRKWKRISRYIDRDFDFSDLNKFLGEISTILGISKNALKTLEESNFDDYESLSKYFYLFPVKFIICSFREFHEIKLKDLELSEEQQTILIRIIENELWGLFSQNYWLEDGDLEGLNRHLDNILILGDKALSLKNNQKLKSNILKFKTTLN